MKAFNNLIRAIAALFTLCSPFLLTEARLRGELSSTSSSSLQQQFENEERELFMSSLSISRGSGGASAGSERQGDRRMMGEDSGVDGRDSSGSPNLPPITVTPPTTPSPFQISETISMEPIPTTTASPTTTTPTFEPSAAPQPPTLKPFQVINPTPRPELATAFPDVQPAVTNVAKRTCPSDVSEQFQNVKGIPEVRPCETNAECKDFFTLDGPTCCIHPQCICGNAGAGAGRVGCVAD